MIWIFLGSFIVCQVLLAVIDQFLGRSCAALNEGTHGANFLTPDVVRNAHHRRILDCRVAVQTVLHLNGVDIVSAGDDRPATNCAIAIPEKRKKIPGSFGLKRMAISLLLMDLSGSPL